MSNKPTQRPKTIRCAIYTRKSTEEGLDQQYNSLDSQRDAGESYIRSQANEGWELVPDRYDDGGFSGGNIERPALKRMMEDMVSNAFLARRDTIARVRWDDEIKTYEHWEFFYRASQIEHLQIAVALDCSVVHDHVAAKPYGALRARPKFRRLGLRKHGFDSLRYPGGGIVHA